MLKRRYYKIFVLVVVVCWLAITGIRIYLEKGLLATPDDSPLLNFFEKLEIVQKFLPALFILPFLGPFLESWQKKFDDFLKLKSWKTDKLEVASDIDERRKRLYLLKKRYSGYIADYKKSCKSLSGLELITLRYVSHADLRSIQIAPVLPGDPDSDQDIDVSRAKENLLLPFDILRDNRPAVILGEAGCGKSFSFINRIWQALEEVDEKDNEQLKSIRFPFLFDAGSYRTLANIQDSSKIQYWLFESLAKHYQIKDEKTRKWLINNDLLLPCIDGIDEIPEADRADFMKGLRDYIEHGRPVIFSCRKEEYRKIEFLVPRDLDIYEVATLNGAEIKQLMIKANEGNILLSSQMIDFLEQKPEMLNYIKVPLILNLFINTFETLQPDDIALMKTLPVEGCVRLLWERYDPKIFSERLLQTEPQDRSVESKRDWMKWQASQHQSLVLARTYVAWLSRQMEGNTFFIEDIQPKWLNKEDPDSKRSVARIKAYYFVSRIISTVLIAVAVGCMIASPFDFAGNGVVAGVALGFVSFQTQGWHHKGGKLKQFAVVVGFVMLFALICGAYQGFTVPRQINDMNGSFSWTESYSGLILGFITGLIFGIRRIKLTPGIDIQPVEKFDFDWRRSLKFGFWGGLAFGIFIGFIGVYIQLNQEDSSTFVQWLRPFLDRLGRAATSLTPGVSYNDTILVFFLAFFVAFSIGFFLTAAMEGRKPDTSINRLDRKTLNAGIWNSLSYSLAYGISTFVVIGLIYGGVLYYINNDVTAVSRGLLFGIGIALVSTLWFGGFEAIQHWTLRIQLYLYGMAPLNFSSWIKLMHKVDFVRYAGAGIKIHHVSLKDYLMSLPVTGDGSDERVTTRFKPHYHRNSKWAIIALLGFLCIFPYLQRYYLEIFWKQHDDIHYQVTSSSLIKTKPNTFRAIENAKVDIIISGQVKLGTFVGKVSPPGTALGLLGFPMDTVYNRFGPFRHGALLVRKIGENAEKWRYLIEPTSSLLSWTYPKTSMSLKKNELLEFCINDKEWQNNSGHFTVRIKAAPAAKKK